MKYKTAAILSIGTIVLADYINYYAFDLDLMTIGEVYYYVDGSIMGLLAHYVFNLDNQSNA